MSGWLWYGDSMAMEAKGAGLTLQVMEMPDESWRWSVYEDAKNRLVDRAHAPMFTRARIAAQRAANRYLEGL